jgi:hypothetical protein
MESRVERLRKVCMEEGASIRNPKKVFKYNR